MCNFDVYVFGSIYICVISMYTAILRKVVGKNVHATIPKGTVAVEPTFVAFL